MRASESCTSRSEVSVPALNAALRSAMVAESRSSVLRAETGVRVSSRTAASVMIRMTRTLLSLDQRAQRMSGGAGSAIIEAWSER